MPIAMIVALTTRVRKSIVMRPIPSCTTTLLAELYGLPRDLWVK
jgi:hypothetical protein